MIRIKATIKVRKGPLQLNVTERDRGIRDINAERIGALFRVLPSAAATAPQLVHNIPEFIITEDVMTSCRPLIKKDSYRRVPPLQRAFGF